MAQLLPNARKQHVLQCLERKCQVYFRMAEAVVMRIDTMRQIHESETVSGSSPVS